MKIIQLIEEIWSIHGIEGYISLPVTVTLTFGFALLGHGVCTPSHCGERLTKAYRIFKVALSAVKQILNTFDLDL